MTSRNDDLTRGFRALAAAGPFEAPAGLEDRLRAAFRRRKLARRALGTGAAVAAVAAAMAGVAVLNSPAPPPPVPRFAGIKAPVITSSGPAIAQSHKTTRARKKPAPASQPMVASTAFYPLPNAGDPLDFGAMVRVQLPRSAMRLVGLPVNEERLSERIQADVLVGQDGMARAVRFVQ